MKVSGSARLDAPPQEVWDALMAPEVLVRTIPGCERLESTGENAYAMTVNAGVASVKGTYTGTVELFDLHPCSSLTMRAEGSGAPGTIGVDVGVSFEAADGDKTQITYDADAVVGGMIGGVGQRMLTSAGKRVAGEFFESVNNVVTGAEAVGAPKAEVDAEAGGQGMPQVYAHPGVAPGGGRDFAKGVAVGAAIALAGVVVGAVAARRR